MSVVGAAVVVVVVVVVVDAEVPVVVVVAGVVVVVVVVLSDVAVVVEAAVVVVEFAALPQDTASNDRAIIVVQTHVNQLILRGNRLCIVSPCLILCWKLSRINIFYFVRYQCYNSASIILMIE